jgi:hypothetical protein
MENKPNLRRATWDWRIGGQSIEEIRVGLRDEITRLRGLGFRVTRRKLEGSPLVNALVLYYLSLPPSERTAIAERAIRLYRHHLQAKGPIPIESLGRKG